MGAPFYARLPGVGNDRLGDIMGSNKDTNPHDSVDLQDNTHTL
jgi:hypothetical protein